MGEIDRIDALCKFVQACPTRWHAIAYLVRVLEDAGFVRLEPGGASADSDRFMVVGSSLLAVRGVAVARRAIVVACDDCGMEWVNGPVSPNDCAVVDEGVVLRGETSIDEWADRDLRVAGISVLREGDGVCARLFNGGGGWIIPTCAPHLRVDPLPVTARPLSLSGLSLVEDVAAMSGVGVQDVVAISAMFVPSAGAVRVGLDGLMVAGARLTTAGLLFLGLTAFLEDGREGSVLVVNPGCDGGLTATELMQGVSLRLELCPAKGGDMVHRPTTSGEKLVVPFITASPPRQLAAVHDLMNALRTVSTFLQGGSCQPQPSGVVERSL